jgi:monofunctional biosynthetic peptidoglycan transglycosylase
MGRATTSPSTVDPTPDAAPVAAASPAPTRAQRIRRRVTRALVVVALVLLLGPVVLILPMNFGQPATTSMILARAAQRSSADKVPAFPRRVVVARDAISPYLRRAVLASEDDRFYLHSGFDLVEISSAIDEARRGGRLRGASTITQQVAKNLFLWEGRSFIRKGYEAYLTVLLELLLSKERILDLYLNLAEWGDGVFGAEAAARLHFGKAAYALTAEESARLAAILPSPIRWSPHGAFVDQRLPDILHRMSYAVER